jgi:hypothetical protein
MAELGTAVDLRDAEVAFGTSHEGRILKRWAASSRYAAGARGYLKGGRYDDFDFVVFGGDGLVICYLEVKLRRSPLSRFGDVMFPARKHDFAVMARSKRRTPVVAVTEYGCGALVEVGLWQEPDARRDIVRRDRPGTNPVPHVFYEKAKMRVLSA